MKQIFSNVFVPFLLVNVIFVVHSKQVIKVSYFDAVILSMFHTYAFTIISIIGFQW